jgi:hypothetical protein
MVVVEQPSAARTKVYSNALGAGICYKFAVHHYEQVLENGYVLEKPCTSAHREPTFHTMHDSFAYQ